MRIVGERVTRLLQPASRRARWNTGLALAGLWLVFAVAYAWALGSPTFPVDDAYIVVRNAQVLISGHADTHFAGTPALAGSTSAVHLLLVAVFALALPPLWASWTVMLLGVLAYAQATLRLAWVMRASLPEALLLVAVALLLAQMPHQLLNGLETSWALAGLSYALALSKDRQAPAWQLPVLCGLLPFLRPELSLVSLLLMLERVLRDVREAGPRRALQALGYALGASLPWVALYWVSTGLPYPNTIEAKRNFFAEGCLPLAARVGAVIDNFRTFQQAIGWFCWVVCLLPLSWLGRIGLLFWLAFGCAYSSSPSLMLHYEQRYMYVLIPWLTYAVAQLIAARRAIVRALASALLLCGLLQAFWGLAEHWDYHLLCMKYTRVQLAPLARFLNENARGRKILLHDAGYVGMFVDAPLADFVGLKTPASIPPHRELTWRECTRASRVRAIERIALREQPSFLVLREHWNVVFAIARGLRARGWALEERYHREYEVFEITGRPGSGVGRAAPEAASDQAEPRAF